MNYGGLKSNYSMSRRDSTHSRSIPIEDHDYEKTKAQFKHQRKAIQDWTLEMKGRCPANPGIVMDPGMAPVPYMITLEGIKGFRPPPDLDSRDRVRLVYNVTLFDNALHQFYGRTYQSRDMMLNETWNAVSKRELVWFYTFHELAKRTSVCIEVYLKVRKDRALDETFHQLGYVNFDLLNSSESQEVNLIHGSPRLLLLGQRMTNSKPAHGKLTVNVVEYPYNLELKRFIPENTLVGKADTIPGLLNDKFVTTQKDVVSKLDVDVYMNSLVIHMSSQIEKRFEDQARGTPLSTPRGTNEQEPYNALAGLNIVDRIVTCEWHNTWKASPEQDTVKLPARPDSNGNYKAKGTLEARNYWVDP